MTLQYMNRMTEEEMDAFDEKCSKFDERQSLEDYTEDIRDTIYLCRNIYEGRKSYTIESIDALVKAKAAHIKAFYDEKEPAAYAAVDIDFCCG